MMWNIEIKLQIELLGWGMTRQSKLNPEWILRKIKVRDLVSERNKKEISQKNVCRRLESTFSFSYFIQLTHYIVSQLQRLNFSEYIFLLMDHDVLLPSFFAKRFILFNIRFHGRFKRQQLLGDKLLKIVIHNNIY